MTLVTPTGLVTVSPETDPELFWATGGAMGLTGVVVRATLRLIPVETSWMWVATAHVLPARRTLMAAMEDTDHEHRYSVAWLDCLGRRSPGGPDPGRPRPARCRPRPPSSGQPAGAPGPGAAAFRRPPRSGWRTGRRCAPSTKPGSEQPRPSAGTLRRLTGFFHPLDAVRGWNLLYGPDGFVQYQFVVPPGRGDVVEEAVAAIASSGVPSLLAVLKRFGPGSPGPLSFAREGWTLALDFPLGPPRLPALLDGLDRAGGGRRRMRLPGQGRPVAP